MRALVCASAIAAGAAAAQPPPPAPVDAAHQDGEIKALSRQDIEDYRAGRGMGLAKAAELNGYPGPAHVLELASQLELTPRQKAQTQALLRKMQGRAIALGEKLVEEERRLDRLFASRSVTEQALETAVARIAALQGELRAAHLRAHVEQSRLLTKEQIDRYGQLRGDGASTAEQHRHPR